MSSKRNSTDRSSRTTVYPANFDIIPKILLIGETGSGKSTFINYLYNYFRKGDLNNLKIAIPCKYHPYPTEQFSHNELNIHDNTQSKTNSCTQYVFTDSTTNKQYLFLDTPGLSDTRGVEQNEINLNRIIDAITKLGNITTIMIIINGSISRLTSYLRSIIACLNGNLPDIIFENVIVVLTNVKKHESPLDLKILNLHGKIYPFYMQNNAFVSDPHTWKTSIRDELENDWNYSMNQMKLILQTIDSFKQISIDTFIQMKQIRNDIKAIIHQAHLEMIQIQKIQNELSQLDSAYKQADRDVATYQDHTRFHTIEKIEVVDATYHSTLCTTCNQVCHNNCRLNETRIIGAQILSQCLVMNNGRCQQCRNHCSYANHYHAKKTIQITYETLEDIINELKKKYDEANEKRNSYQKQMLTIAETKEFLDKTLKQNLNELKNKSKELVEICSAFNLAEELNYLIKQFKIESDLLENLETKLQNEQLIQNLTKFAQSIEETQEKTRRRRSSMQIIYIDQSVETKPIDINHLKTIDLIELHNKTTDPSLIRLILEELHQRAQGKSTGPLITSDEIMIIKKFIQKYDKQSIQDLSYSYRQLQKKIDAIIDSNILKIIDVNHELLIENCIVQTLLEEKEKNQHEILSPPTTSRSFSHTTNNSFPQPVYPPPYPANESLPLSSRIPTSNSALLGFTHIFSAPYPSSDELLPIPALPPDNHPLIDQSNNNHPTQPVFSLEDYRYNSINTKSSKSSFDHQDAMPMPINNQQHLTNLHNSHIGFSFNNTKGNQDSTLLNERSSRPDIIPLNNDSLNSPKPQRNHMIAELDDERFRSFENTRLVLMYANATLQENESRTNAIYQELERRCYGEYPKLIKENKNIFQEKLKIHEMKTIGELLIAQTGIKQKIRRYLQDNDVTLIDSIPQDLIIEANALSHLVLSKGRI